MSIGFSREIRCLPRRRVVFWICTRAIGKAGHWARKISCFRAMRKQASRRGSVVTTSNRLDGAAGVASKPNTSERALCNIWRHGMCIVALLWAVARNAQGFSRSDAWSDQMLKQEPYCGAERLFFIVDNGSSHRGQAFGGADASA